METSDFLILKSLVPDIKIVSQSEFRIIAYSEKHSLLYHEWLDTFEIDDDTFKSEGLELFHLIEQLRPACLVPNDKKRKTSISDEINEFLVVNFQPFYSHPSMKKVALVNNEMLSTQGQAETVMEDVKQVSPAEGAQFNFFNGVEQAIKWVIQK